MPATIAIVEETASLLKSRGFAACAYHGKMEASERNASQNAWMRGDAPILVGTLAFGLGINKPDVRAVIHLALPKSLEQYYQEAGRAGRDGLPADCVLLWQKKDTSLLARLHQPDCRPGGEAPSMAAISLDLHIRRCGRVPAETHLPSLRRDPEMGVVWRLWTRVAAHPNG